jgi:hypothetical protein
LWIILDEFNEDAIGRSFRLEPEPPLGRFSRAFFLPLLREFIARRESLRGVIGREETDAPAGATFPFRRRTGKYGPLWSFVF